MREKDLVEPWIVKYIQAAFMYKGWTRSFTGGVLSHLMYFFSGVGTEEEPPDSGGWRRPPERPEDHGHWCSEDRDANEIK